jgi:hypothetical protein
MSESEDRVAGYLGELRDDPPAPGTGLTPAIVHRARWQQAVRRPVRAIGALAAALGDGLALVLGSTRRREP